MQGYKPVGYQSISGGTATAFGLTAPSGAQAAFITVENQALRYRVDGVDPTDTEGHLAPVGDALWLDEYELSTWRARSTSTTNATTVRVTYYI